MKKQDLKKLFRFNSKMHYNDNLEDYVNFLEGIIINEGYVVIQTVKEKQLSLKEDDIVKFVLKHYRVTKELLFSRTRVRAVAEARQVIMYLMYHHLNRSETYIANLFDMDHSNVNHAKRVVDVLKETNQFIFAINLNELSGYLSEQDSIRNQQKRSYPSYPLIPTDNTLRLYAHS